MPMAMRTLLWPTATAGRCRYVSEHRRHVWRNGSAITECEVRNGGRDGTLNPVCVDTTDVAESHDEADFH